MQPNELRIGNWIKLKYSAMYYPYAKLCSTGNNIIHVEVNTEAVKGSYESTEFANLEPIPLTPEVVSNITFKQGRLIFDMGEIYLEDWAGRKVGNPLRYLHELQNLYFAIYSEELEVSL